MTVDEIGTSPVDLSITKTAGGYEGGPTNKVDPGETFWYDITVTNTSNIAHGYTFYDDLPIWLKPAGDTWFTPGTNIQGRHYPDDGAAVLGYAASDNGETLWDGPWGDKTAEICSTYTEGCQGYGDIIKIRTTNNLGPRQSATYRIYVTFFAKTTAYCNDHENDPRCNSEEYPEKVSNTACVWPYDVETPSAGCQDPVLCGTSFNPVPPAGGTWDNNCGSTFIPTKVKIAYFVAGASEKGVTLKWETSSELNNMGFNLYRSTSPFGAVGSRAEKLNPTMIPSTNPGGNEGAAYSWDDTTAKPGVKYYYWLEDIELDGKTNLTGPVDASVSLKISPIRIAPNLGLPVFRP